MVSVRINGEESKINTGNTSRIADVVELVKAAIDPEHMITSILIDGRELDDSDWGSSPEQFGTAILEIETGSPNDFVNDRINKAYQVVQACYFEFRDARKTFQAGNMLEGNQKLVRAVNTLRSFFEWYSSILEISPKQRRDEFNIDNHVRDISDICKRICQQQLYQSWWALGETISKELEPKLDALEDFFRKLRTKM